MLPPWRSCRATDRLQGAGKGGHGVGLTIVRRLSDRFGWPLRLESTLGIGTKATIELPLAQPFVSAAD